MGLSELIVAKTGARTMCSMIVNHGPQQKNPKGLQSFNDPRTREEARLLE